MPTVSLTRPAILKDSSLAEAQRWTKQTSDNIDRINLRVATVQNVQLTHGVATTLNHPFADLGLTVVGIEAVYCLGVNTTTGATYTTLGVPRIDWQPGNTGQVSVTATYPSPGTGVGAIGEIISANATPGSGFVTLSNATPKTILSITLGPGKWGMDGIAGFDATVAATSTRVIGGINVTTGDSIANTVEGVSRTDAPSASINASNIYCPIPGFKVTLTAAATTYFLVGRCDFTAGTIIAFGEVTATRIEGLYETTKPLGRVTLRYYAQ